MKKVYKLSIDVAPNNATIVKYFNNLKDLFRFAWSNYVSKLDYGEILTVIKKECELTNDKNNNKYGWVMHDYLKNFFEDYETVFEKVIPSKVQTASRSMSRNMPEDDAEEFWVNDYSMRFSEDYFGFTLEASLLCDEESSDELFMLDIDCGTIPKQGLYKAIYMEVSSEIELGTSANSLLIYKTLNETPQKIEEIQSKIKCMYGSNIERKAIGRNLQIIMYVFSSVKHCKEGYYIEKFKED